MEKLTDAFLLISKPYGITSRKFLNEIRNLVNEKRIGHSGTLDPMATGLLFVALGNFTRLLPYVSFDTKEYFIEIVFGIETDTWDITGKVIKEQKVSLSENDILKILPKFVGEINQKIPFFSAKKWNGIEFYKLARKGTFIEAFKKVKIYGIEYCGFHNNRLLLRVNCESGAYMRSLAYELGLALEVSATLSAITRTKIGPFSIKDATTLGHLKRGDFSRGIVSPQSVLGIPVLTLQNGENFLKGNAHILDKVIVIDERYGIIGIGIVKDNKVQPKRVFLWKS